MVLNKFQKQIKSLLKTIYDELKIHDPQIEALPTFHSDIEEISQRK